MTESTSEARTLIEPVASQAASLATISRAAVTTEAEVAIRSNRSASADVATDGTPI
jgi:hypothetical protein